MTAVIYSGGWFKDLYNNLFRVRLVKEEDGLKCSKDTELFDMKK